jgi:hypothetical protein
MRKVKAVKETEVAFEEMNETLNDLLEVMIDIKDSLSSRTETKSAPASSDPSEAKMFAALDACDLPETTQEFISSLREGYSVYGFLTDKQYSCLHRNYMRFVHGKRFSV